MAEYTTICNLHKTRIVSTFYIQTKISYMKKWIIGSLVGAIIVFAWQFLSWTIMGIHSGEEKYTPAQDQVLSALSSANLEDGMYMLPNTQPGTTMQQQQEFMQQNEGKPWARIVYVRSLSTSMTTPMIT